MEVLILAAHADDETLGAGGLIPKLINSGHEISVILASDGKIKARGEKIHNFSAFKKVCNFFGIASCKFLNLEDQFFDKYPIADISNKVNEIAGQPDLIISHVSSDLNKDHRIMSDVAKIIGRPKYKPVSILGMEIPNASAWNASFFSPDLYVDITDTIATKLRAFSYYKNEIKDFPYPYSFKGIEVAAQFRGMEAGCNFAEAYEVIRLHNQHLAL